MTSKISIIPVSNWYGVWIHNGKVFAAECVAFRTEEDGSMTAMRRVDDVRPRLFPMVQYGQTDHVAIVYAETRDELDIIMDNFADEWFDVNERVDWKEGSDDTAH